MTLYVRPQDFTHGPPCALCGWPNLPPGHNTRERRTLANDYVWHSTLAALWGRT
jgi:hypothetical protein